MKLKARKLFTRRKKPAKAPSGVPDNVRITNETVAARRDEVLSSARKYIYPLQASRHRIVKFSIGIFVAAVVSFFVFCGLELYKFQSTSAFMYAVTRVLPVPAAILGNKYAVSYNTYLFELRHYMHYYQTQQHVDFSSAAGKQQLAVFRQRSMDQAVQDAYVQQLAKEHHLSVSTQDVDAAVALVRSQNRLGASDAVFRSVLAEFWGWSVDDFRRELRQELLAQKVVAALDMQTHARAEQALSSLQHGADFNKLAKEVSDDAATRANGGDYGITIGRTSTDIAPQVVATLFNLKRGQYSGIIDTGYSLEIVKVTEAQANTVHAAHIAFNFRPVTDFTKDLQSSQQPHILISLK